jgi:hypothetical protein
MLIKGGETLLPLLSRTMKQLQKNHFSGFCKLFALGFFRLDSNGQELI